MPREKIKPPTPKLPFYDEEGYLKRNPYIDRVLHDYPERLVHPSDAVRRKGSWRRWTAGRPLHVEIGPGKGRHIAEYSLAHPEAIVLGIELKFRRFYRIAERLTRTGAKNAFVLRFDANYLDWVFGGEDVSKVMVFFPDPWWNKKKQRYKRLITEEFVRGVHDFLTPGGLLEIKTDHPLRFEEYLELVRESPLSLRRQSRDLVHSPYVEENIETIFETKFREQGLPTHYLQAVKPG